MVEFAAFYIVELKLESSALSTNFKPAPTRLPRFRWNETEMLEVGAIKLNLKTTTMHLDRISFMTIKKTLFWLITLLGIWILVKP